MKRIQTKLALAMSAVAALTLAITGVALIFNITVDYRRDFYADVRSALESITAENARELFETDKISDKNCYIIKDGNVVYSTSRGGSIKMTDNLRALISGGSCSESSTLDFGRVLDDGRVIYVTGTKAGLYSQIGSLSLKLIQALAVGILIAVIISWVLSKRLTRSIKTLERGAMRMAEGDFSPIPLESRDEIGALCTVLNRMGEQIQRDYDEFEKEEARRREFVANVSHELKTPLTVIKSYSQTLGSADVDKDTQQEFLQIIDSEADRMSDTVSQLLELSALTTKQVEKAEQTDLVLLSRDIIKSLDCKGLSITIEGEGTVLRSKKRVRTILANIIENAIKYTESGTVSIKVYGNILKVKDSGIGMSKEELSHVFERFYRADKARGRGGTGLGLAIAKESADLIGAKISVESVISEYTEFTIEF